MLLRLEGYEDALHNLVSDETVERETPGAKAFKEKAGGDAYRLNYPARLLLESGKPTTTSGRFWISLSPETQRADTRTGRCQLARISG